MNFAPQTHSLSRPSLHIELVNRLQSMIVDGKLLPGSKVPEKDLCEQFGVSRTPLREALKVLAADGLISLEPNRGAWVSKVTLEELREVFPVMGALEALSGELACANITDEQIAYVRDLHNEMVQHFKDENLDAYFQVNQKIHEAILEAADNATLSTQYRSLASRIRRARYLANMSQERWQQAIEEHERILEALENRQGEKLAGILKQHLKNKLDTYCHWLMVHGDNA